MTTFYKWTVEFEVAAEWVADGFVMTDQTALDMLSARLSSANIGTELRARVIKQPSLTSIAKRQGYPSAAVMLASDKAFARDLSDGHIAKAKK